MKPELLPVWQMHLRNVLRPLVLAIGGLLLADACCLAASGKWTSQGPPPSWTPGTVTVLAVDSQDPDLVYAGTTEGIYRSRDGGATWEPIDNGIPTRPFATLETPQIAVEALATDPSRPGNLYVGLAQGFVNNTDAVGRLHKSFDAGSSWQKVALEIPSRDPGFRFAVSAVAIDPTNANVLYACAYAMTVNSVPLQFGVFKSTDAGASWSILRALAAVKEVAIAVDPTNSANIYAASQFGEVARSSDGGQSWTIVSVSNGFLDNFLALSIDPFRPSVLLVGTASGIFQSRDSGRSFERLSSLQRRVPVILFDPAQPGRLFAGTDGGIFVSENGGESFSASPILAGQIKTLVSAPSNPRVLYAAADGKVFRSDDGGLNWQPGGPQAISRITVLVADPTREGHVIASASPGFLFESQDGGGHWDQIGSDSNFRAALTYDPSNPRILYAGEAPEAPPFGRPCSLGISRSNDGGRTWTTIGLEDRCVGAIGVDSRNNNVLYALATKPLDVPALFKSSDAGVTWTKLNGAGIPSAFVLDPANSSVLYAGSAAGMVRSIDGGSTWFAINYGLLSGDGRLPEVRTILISPSDSRVLYVLTSAGFFRTMNAGSLWQPTGSGPDLQEIRAVIIDPQRAGILYAAGLGGISVTNDGGAIWMPFQGGLEDASVSTLAIDPSGRGLHAGTLTRGVFDYTIPLDRMPPVTTRHTPPLSRIVRPRKCGVEFCRG